MITVDDVFMKAITHMEIEEALGAADDMPYVDEIITESEQPAEEKISLFGVQESSHREELVDNLRDINEEDFIC